MWRGWLEAAGAHIRSASGSVTRRSLRWRDEGMGNVAAPLGEIRGASVDADPPDVYLRIRRARFGCMQVPSPRPIIRGAPCAAGPAHRVTGLMRRVGAQPTRTPVYQQILRATNGTIQHKTIAGV